jgi:hypothetical protein
LAAAIILGGPPAIEKDAPIVVTLAAQFATDLAKLDAALPRNTGVMRQN